jgi:hypothetical protein
MIIIKISKKSYIKQIKNNKLNLQSHKYRGMELKNTSFKKKEGKPSKLGQIS